MDGLAGRRSLAPVHDNDHRFGLAFSNQIVDDEIGPPLFNPAGLIFSTAMPQDEYRVTLSGIVVVIRRCIDKGPPPCAGYLRIIPLHAHLAMRHILDIIEIDLVV